MGKFKFKIPNQGNFIDRYNSPMNSIKLAYNK